MHVFMIEPRTHPIAAKVQAMHVEKREISLETVTLKPNLTP